MALQVLPLRVAVLFLRLAHSGYKQPLGRHTSTVDNSLPHKELPEFSYLEALGAVYQHTDIGFLGTQPVLGSQL